jgi:transitional endoplasmic reticulum ATPase
MTKKPTLFNDQVIGRKHIVLKRLSLEEHYEVYQLKDNQFLVLIIGMPISFIEDSLNVKNLLLNGKNYFYVIFPETFTELKIKEVFKTMLNPKGLKSIAGMDSLKKVFSEDIIEPLKQKERFAKFKVTLPNAMLLFGPPGCGKTYFAMKIAEEIGYNLMVTSQADFGSTYIHGTSLKIKEIFDQSRKNAPTLLLIDEIDSLFPKRETLGSGENYKQEEINEFLVQLNQSNQSQVLVLAATNKPQLLDDALLRTGRMDKLIYIGLPDLNSRIELFKFYLRNRPHDDLDYNLLGVISEHFNCSDIEYICNEAAKSAVYNNHEKITLDHLNNVINRTKPSVSDSSLTIYQNFEKMMRR